jgi:hypothetical protein
VDFVDDKRLAVITGTRDIDFGFGWYACPHPTWTNERDASESHEGWTRFVRGATCFLPIARKVKGKNGIR